MGICLQAAWRQSANPTVSVPAPCDAKTPSVDWWYDAIAKQCAMMAANGVTAILLPPVLKTNAGQYPGADGYGVYDDYDIGSKDQFFSRNTRFGTDEQLRRCIAIAAANGVDAYVDFVPHQRMGGSYGEYRYLGADGKTPNGRFPKHKSYFRGDPAQGFAAWEDPVADSADDFSFGDQLLVSSSKPPGVVAQGLIDAGDWLVRTLGLRGGRIDDTKGQVASFVKRWATSKAMAGCYWFGEYADGSPDNLNWWVNQVDGTVSAADFAFHYRAKDICEGAGRWDMRGLLSIGFLARWPEKAFTFVESPDTDTNGFGGIRWNKALAYFLMLTLPGYPCLYYRDWSKDTNCYGWGLQDSINNYAWIATHLVAGDVVQRYADPQVCVYERTGGPRLLCGVNNDPGGWHSQWVPTGFGPGVQLHDYTGHVQSDIYTNQDGWVYLSIPPNDNGLGTVAFSRVGLSQPTIPGSRACTQVFFGSPDLDIGPISSGNPLTVGRIWCAAHTEMTLVLTHAKADWGNADEIRIDVVGSTKALLQKELDPADPKSNTVHAKTIESGWHTIVISLKSTEVATVDFELAATYTATKVL